MTEEKRSVNKIWVGLFYAGYLLVFIIAFSALKNLPFEFQAMLATASALIWYFSASITSRIPNKAEKDKNSHIRMFWIGHVTIFLAILYGLIIKPKTELAFYGQITNLIFSCYGLINLYGALVIYLFPNLLKTISAPPSNPLSEYPTTVQEIIERGRNWIVGAFGIPAFLFFMAGAIGNTIYAADHHGDSSDFFLIIIWVGLIIGFILSFIATYKWPQWARKSGIPEEELKAAAKAAHMWWPKIKEK